MHTKSHFFTWATWGESGGNRAYNLQLGVVSGHLIAAYRAYRQGIYHLLKKKKKTGNSGWKIKWLASCHAVWKALERAFIDREDVIFLLILVSSPDLVKFVLCTQMFLPLLLLLLSKISKSP